MDQDNNREYIIQKFIDLNNTESHQLVQKNLEFKFGDKLDVINANNKQILASDSSLEEKQKHQLDLSNNYSDRETNDTTKFNNNTTFIESL